MPDSAFPSGAFDDLPEEILEAIYADPPATQEQLIARYPELAEQIRILGGVHQQLQPLRPLITNFPPLGPSPLGVVGNHEQLDVIKEGGMGVIYRARHRTLHRVDAIKMIKKGALASNAERDRF